MTYFYENYPLAAMLCECVAAVAVSIIGTAVLMTAWAAL